MMNETIIKKGYKIDLSKIDEGFCYDESLTSVCAENKSKAKSLLLKGDEAEYMKLFTDGAYLNFLNMPVVRAKEYDIVLFEGIEMPRKNIDKFTHLKERKNELIAILEDPSISHCYIKKRGEYYRPNNCGYTSFQCFAGVYEKENAVQSAFSCEDICVTAIDNAVHNKMIDATIEQILKNKI